MATITATATPVIKYSDTTDITLLLPADIAKFTEKDFALFTTQQQSDLSAAQVAPLTAKQVSTLPLKLVEPDTIAAMTTAAVASFDLKTFTTDQFAALTSLQFKALTSTQISALTALQVDALTPDQASVFTSSQIAALAPKLVSVLNGSIIERLPAAAIAGFNAKNIIGLTTDSIAAITTDQAAVLTSSQIAALPSKIIAELPVDDIAVLTPAAIKGFTKANIGALDLTTLSSDQFSALTPTQTGLLSPAQLGALTVDFAPFLTSKAISLLTPVQLGSLATDVISALDSLTVKGLTVKNITGLTADQIGALTSDQTGNLSKVQLSTFTTGQISNLSPESVLAIKPAIFKALNSDLLSHLDPTAFSSLTDVQLGSLTAGQVAGLSVDQINKFSGSQIALIKPAALANLTTGTISSLSDDAVASLTDKQLARFTTAADGQLAHFTPAQMTKFSTDAKTWLTTSKGFATIESTAKTGSGVNTTGTIVGAAAAETITSGGGNDIITTVGGLADKIISGAGSDTISITGDIHSVDAGDGVDTLNITSFSGNFSKISGVEVVKLAVASAGQTLALSGITNAFATVNADILADGQSLGLTGSYNVDKVAVSLIAGDVDANSSSTSFNVTATTGSNIIKTGSGADSILAGAGSDSIEAGSGNDTINGEADNDTIDGGANVDSMTGGAGNDTFVFNTTSNGATSAAALSTNFDTITDYTTGSDVIDFVNPLSIHATTAAPTNDALAKISATGLATFTPATTTMVGRITAVEAATNHVANSSAIFTDVTGTDAYVFISDGASGVGTGDVLIKLAGNGAAAKSLSISSTGDVTSISAYTAATFVSGISGSTINDSDAVYIVDGGAAISTAIGDNSLLGASPYANKTKIDVIDASDTVAIAMTAAQEQAITAAKLASDDTIHIVDTATNIQNSWAALITDAAKIDLIDSSTEVISLTYDQATTLISAGVKFAATDAITITGITDAQAVAASALTTTTLGGLSITLTGDGAISTLTQASVAAQDASTKWATSEALTVTATDSTGEHTISGLLKSVIGGSSIKLQSSGGDNAVELTYDEVRAQDSNTKWVDTDNLTVTGIDTNTKAAVASAFNKTALGGSSITLNTTSNAAVSLENSVAITQPTGTKWSGTTPVTITGAVADSAAAQAKYVSTTFGGSAVTIEVATSITAAALDTAIANNQKFSGALTVTGIAPTDETAGTAGNNALTDFTKVTTGASSVYLIATDGHWDVDSAALTTALSSTNAVKFTTADSLTVTVAGTGGASGTDTTAESLTLITAFTPTTTGVLAANLVLDSADNAWTVAYSDLPTVADFASDDAVVITGVTVSNAATAAVKNISAIGGSGITLDASGAAISITDAVAKAQPATTLWKSDSALTITAIATGADETNALTTHTKAIHGGSSVTLVAADNTWDVAKSDLATALTAGEFFAGTLTVSSISAIDSSTNAAATILAYTPTTTGATNVVLDSVAGTNSWTVAVGSLPLTGAKFAAGDAVVVTGAAAGDATKNIATYGGSGITLDAGAGAISITDAVAKTQPSTTKWKSDSALTVTAIAAADEATALTRNTKTIKGGSGVTLTAADGTWSVDDGDLTTALAAPASEKLAGTLTVTGIANGDELAALTSFTSTLTGASSVILTATDTNWDVTATQLTTALGAGSLLKFAGTVDVTGIVDSAAEASALTAFTSALTGATTVNLTADDGTWSVAAGKSDNTTGLTKALAAGIKLAGTLEVTSVGETDNVTQANSLTQFTATATGATTVVLNAGAATSNAWSIGASTLSTALAAGIKLAADDALTVTGITATATGSTTNSNTTIDAYTTALTGAVSVVLDASSNAWTVAQGDLPLTGVTFKTDDVVTVTVAGTGDTEATAAVLTTAGIGGASIVLDGDGAVSLADAVANVQYAAGSATAKWSTGDALTITGIGATTLEANALTHYTKANMGGSSVTLNATDGTWTVIGSGATTPLDTALAAGVKLAGALTVDAISTTNTDASHSSATIAKYTTALTGATSVVLNSIDTTGDAWAVSYADVAALPAAVKFASSDVITITVPNANEAAAAALATSVKGGASIVLDGDTAVSLAKTDADAQITAANTKWKSDDAVTVTGLASTDQVAALTAYTIPKLGGSKTTLDTSVAGGWALTDSTLAAALTAATANKLALTTDGAAVDKVTVSGITIGRQASTLTEFTKTLLGAEAVVLDADSNAWSVAGSDLTTALGEGIKFASTDTALTVTAIASVDRATALTAFTAAKTGATNIVLDSVTGTDAWSVAGSDLTTALAAGIKFGATDALTVTGITGGNESTTTFTKATTGAKSVVLDAADNAWSVAYGALDTALSTAVGIKFASGDTVTVTGIVTRSGAGASALEIAQGSVLQANAIAAYTPTKIGSTNVVLDSVTGDWTLSESALALKAGTVTFANSDTLTVLDIASANEITALRTDGTTGADGTVGLFKYLPAKANANNIGATSVILDAADNAWTLTAADADAAVTAGIKFGADDTVAISGATSGYANLAFSNLTTTTTLGGTSISLSGTGTPATTTLSVADAQSAITAGFSFAANDVVEITMNAAANVLTVNTASQTLGSADLSFVYAAGTAGGVTFKDNASNAAALNDGDYFTTSNMDVITGFTVLGGNTAASSVNDILNLAAFTPTLGAVTWTASGTTIADDKYDTVRGTYATDGSGYFTASTTGADTLVVWDGNTAATAVDMVGVVLMGVSALVAADDLKLV